MFSFDGECVYKDLRCLRNKTNMPEEKQIWISSNFFLLVGEPKSRIVQKHTFFAPERYTAGILNTDSLNSA